MVMWFFQCDEVGRNKAWRMTHSPSSPGYIRPGAEKWQISAGFGGIWDRSEKEAENVGREVRCCVLLLKCGV